MDTAGITVIPAGARMAWRPVWLVEPSTGATRGFARVYGPLDLYENAG